MDAAQANHCGNQLQRPVVSSGYEMNLQITRTIIFWALSFSGLACIDMAILDHRSGKTMMPFEKVRGILISCEPQWRVLHWISSLTKEPSRLYSCYHSDRPLELFYTDGISKPNIAYQDSESFCNRRKTSVLSTAVFGSPLDSPIRSAKRTINTERLEGPIVMITAVNPQWEIEEIALKLRN